MILEDKDICRGCPDKCCEKSGCDYYIEDFESLTIDYLYSKLKEGNISIVAALNFNYFHENITCTPFLYLGVRNVGRGVVDLFSMKTSCSVLTETGCPYSFNDRPSGAKFFIPRKDRKCRPLFDQRTKLLEWQPYQKVLSRLVKRFTGKSVDENLREDVIKVMYDIKCENFDGVKKSEIEDILFTISSLVMAFPREAEVALEMYKKEHSNVLMYKSNKR